MSAVRIFWECLFSPKLYKVYGTRGNNDGMYEPSHLERWGDQIISSLSLMWRVGLFTAPVLTYLIFKKGYFVFEGVISLTKFAVGVSLVLVASYCLRSYGRINSPVYFEFQRNLQAAKKDLNPTTKRNLLAYDFDFSAWPVEFRWSDVEGDEKKRLLESVVRKRTDNSLSYKVTPCSLISYLMAHTVGIRLIYPGAISAFGYMMEPVLLQGRVKLIEKEYAERFKLKARDGNDIDTVFVDRRGRRINGNTLVICSEGNAGFYEIGIMVTPLKANYSVIGWNHPGFGGSTGMPFPEQEQNAIDIVIQFAIHRLGFKPEDIILFGWSIGGYALSWAAMVYPEVKSVILDGSFDDLLPLAIPRMPLFLSSLVKHIVRHYVNLNIATLLSHYQGPVLLIRRTDDEVICLIPGELSTNRGNHLLVSLLRHRYPNLFDENSELALSEWLACWGTNQRLVYNKYIVDNDKIRHQLAVNIPEDIIVFPLTIGENMDTKTRTQVLLYLANKYFIDYNSTHCTPLPSHMFIEPELAIKS